MSEATPGTAITILRITEEAEEDADLLVYLQEQGLTPGVTVDVADMWEHGDSTGNVKLREYDIIYVPPTLLQQAADFVSGILVPITSIFRQVFQTLFSFDNPDVYFLRGGRRGNFGFF